jgi:hypothetical protein
MKIEELESFKSLNKIQKSVCLKRKNLKEISHCLNVIKNIGYDQWLISNNTYYVNKLLISEIVNHNFLIQL